MCAGRWGIYFKFEYLERIYCDFAGFLEMDVSDQALGCDQDYSAIEGYHVKNYKEQPHLYIEETDQD